MNSMKMKDDKIKKLKKKFDNRKNVRRDLQSKSLFINFNYLN